MMQWMRMKSRLPRSQNSWLSTPTPARAIAREPSIPPQTDSCLMRSMRRPWKISLIRLIWKKHATKRDTQGKEEPEAPQKPPTQDSAQETVDQSPPVPGTEEGKEYHGKMIAGMWRPWACIFFPCLVFWQVPPLDLLSLWYGCYGYMNDFWTVQIANRFVRKLLLAFLHRRDLSEYERGKKYCLLVGHAYISSKLF